MDRTENLIYNLTGQTLEFYPPEWHQGVPSSAATYKVWEGGADMDDSPEYSGTATADSVDTTFDADSGKGQANAKRLNLTATTNIATGRFYVATNAEGKRELVQPVAISSGAYVDLGIDAANSYANADTFKGLRQYFTVDATHIQDEASITGLTQVPYKVEWSYTINSVAYKYHTYYRVVRSRAQHSVTIHDLMEVAPDVWAEQPESVRGTNWQGVIDGAWDRVKFDLGNYGMEVHRVRDSDLNELVRSCALATIASMGISHGARDVEAYAVQMENQYKSDIHNFAQRAQLDQGSSGAATKYPVRQLTFRR